MKFRPSQFIGTVFLKIIFPVAIAGRTKRNMTRNIFAAAGRFVLPGIIILQLLSTSLSAQFTLGNLAVLKVGDGATALSSAGTPLSVVEFNTAGVATGTVVVLPSTGTTKITASGSATSEGALTLSAEWDRLVVAGYDAATGDAGVASSASTTYNRELFTVAKDGTYSKAAFSATAHSGNNIRGGTALGSTYFSAGASGGVVLLSPGTALGAGITKARVVQIINGQTYFSSDQGGAAGQGLFALGAGVPTAVSTATLLGATSSPFGFAISPDSNIMYVADDVAGIKKYSRSGATYNLTYVANSTACRGLAVDFTGSHPILYATTAEGALPYNTIIKIIDLGAASTASIIATSPTNTLYRGITFSPACFGAITLTGASTVCSGDSSYIKISGNPYASVAFTVNGAGGHTAIIGANGTTTVSTGGLTTDATIALASITTPGCSSEPLTGSVFVSVNPVPADITGTSIVCNSFTTTLNETTTGGTWSSSSSSVATVGSTGVVGGAGIGTAVISYTLPTTCYITKQVTVHALPSAISGTKAFCSGTSSALTDAPSGGTWVSNNTAVATITSPGGIVSGSVSVVSTSTITYTAANGCYATAVVTVNPVPLTIGGVASVCVGTTVGLTESSTGGTWSSSASGTATVSTTGQVTGVAAGAVAISYILPTGCYVLKDMIVNPPPSAISGSFAVCIGSTSMLSDPTTPGTWSSADAAVAAINTTSGLMSGVSEGVTDITYTSAAGCQTSTSVTVNGLPSVISGSANICVGIVSSLTSIPGGGTWSSSNVAVATIGTTTGVAAAIAAGNTTIVYTAPTGCTTSAVLTVNPLPAPIYGPVNVCTGAMIALSNATAGGTWSSASSFVTVGLTSGSVSGLSVGTASITYTLGTGCMTATTLTVNLTPAPITGSLIVCGGSSTTLSDMTTGGTWSTGASTVVGSGSAGGIVTGLATGMGLVTYTMPSGCYVTALVTVSPTPVAITGTLSSCVGVSSTLHDAIFGGTWTSNDITIASIGVGTGIVTGIAAGVAIITYALPSGCYVTASVTTNPLPPVISGTGITCVGATTNLSDGTSGGTWSNNSALVATVGSGTGTVTGVSPGTSKITYTLPTGCKVTSIVTISPTPSAIGGAALVCKGTTVTLVNSAGGGLWTSSNAAVATLGTSGSSAICILTGVSAGVSNITYTIGGCIAWFTATVSAVPSMITGNAVVCTQSGIVLNDSVAGGLWTSANATIASVAADGTVTGVAQGTTVVTYSINTICIATALVTVNPSAPFARITTHPDGSLCTGTMYQNFGATVVPGTNVKYEWTAANADVYATGNTGQYSLVSFPNSGDAVIRLSSGLIGSGCVRTDSIVVNVSATVAPYPRILFYSGYLVFADNTADSYQWGNDNALTLDSSIAAGEKNQDYFVSVPDVVHYRYWAISLHEGCIQKTYFNKPTDATFISDNGNALSLYPVPAIDELHIELTGVNITLATAAVVDIAGKTIATAVIGNGSGKIDVRAMPPGTYSIIISSDDRMLAAKTFVKQ
jgi:uncharacterized protein YjdB